MASHSKADEFLLKIPNIPVKYVFNSSEERLVENYEDEKFDVVRGGDGNNRIGLRARYNEIRASFLTKIRKMSLDLSDCYCETITEKLGKNKFTEYKDVIYQYCHNHKCERPELVISFEGLIDKYIQKSHYNIYYCKNVFKSNILKYITVDDIPILLEINGSFFEKIYKNCEEDGAWTFIHRGMKHKPYYPECDNFSEKVLFEKNLMNSYSFSISLPESFAGHHQLGLNIPVMIGAIAEECTSRVISFPMLFKDFKEFHYDSFEVILIPPLETTNIYEDVDMDGTLEYITLNNTKGDHWYLGSINNE